MARVATCNGLPSLHVTHFGLDLGVLGAGKGRWALMESPLFTGTWFKVFLDPNLLRFDTPVRRKILLSIKRRSCVVRFCGSHGSTNPLPLQTAENLAPPVAFDSNVA